MARGGLEHRNEDREWNDRNMVRLDKRIGGKEKKKN